LKTYESARDKPETDTQWQSNQEAHSPSKIEKKEEIAQKTKDERH
jgi:hypothetical protein